MKVFTDEVVVETIHRPSLSISLWQDVVVSTGYLWAAVTIRTEDQGGIVLKGLPKRDAAQLSKTLADVTEAFRDLRFRISVREVLDWVDRAQTHTHTARRTKGWVTRDAQRWILASRPPLDELFSKPDVIRRLEALPESLRESVRLWWGQYSKAAQAINDEIRGEGISRARNFFENAPLNLQQAESVVCFDSRVLLVAAAGSGKTHTMVAKAGYALQNRYFEPQRILLLAFNREAAKELRTRIVSLLGGRELGAEKIVVRTFHAFGGDVIGEVRGAKPTVAPWLEQKKDVEVLVEIIDSLKDSNEGFRRDWDMFRVVLGQELPRFGDAVLTDTDDRDGFWTLNNESVKSRGEQLIANWLFYNGVEYQYEKVYEHPTADINHRQYRPDFYLPAICAYLEHWGLDANGVPPASFEGYVESMQWKRGLHAMHQTTLLETTTADLWSGKAFNYLERELTARGVVLDPNPSRPVKGRKPIENRRLATLFRSFLVHAKGSTTNIALLRSRLEGGLQSPFIYRMSVFLQLFEHIRQAWDARLAEEGCVDFEDMLTAASDHISSGEWRSPFDLVMVDEFQDVSEARARILEGLVREPGRCLFGVGDDWQSINRYAGADVSIMRDFEQRFGKGHLLKLEETFRCPQWLCDISSQFVQRNPSQIRKNVRSTLVDAMRKLKIFIVADESAIPGAVAQILAELAEQNASAQTESAFVIGRYQKERAHAPLAQQYGAIKVTFCTAHAAKGLEADHVIVPKLTKEVMGFPSQIADDPVLQLAMPSLEQYPHAEERRLFYVALTRARRTVTLITLEGCQSAFIDELMRDFSIEPTKVVGNGIEEVKCPRCGKGNLVKRKSRYGEFMGCSRYPACEFKCKC